MQPGPWFEYETGGNSEDLMFCARATEKYGFDIYCDFSTISGHYALVPMGYAEFINKYQQRGVELSSYTPTEAIEWFAEFFEKPKEDTTELFKRGSPHFFGDYWKSLPDTLNENTEREIYRNATSGRPYIVELLYWNASPEFLSLRQRFISIRNRNVIEIGAGIGTLALQLAIQRNNVLAVEVNPVLRKFIKYRLKKTVDNIETKMGNLKVAGDGWLKAHTKYDVAFALDVFEHMPLPDLKATIDTLGEVLVTGGHLYYHNNWGQQDIFPMHHDYADIWSELLVDAGFYQISPNEAVRT
jgi:protein-L-isoaspartate O-methyltransferase